ncbi:MAG: guanylate kinase [Alphaproteobacteria bacterium]
MLVLSSPSGAGKSTISRALLDSEENLTLSVSATTRAPRSGEVDGTDYFFVDKKEFDRMVSDGEMLEHAEVFGNHYGTPKLPVDHALSTGKDVLFDVDWQGARKLRNSAGQDMVGVFILPPSHDELERRLYSRGQDTDEVVKKRMAEAAGEMEHWAEYDYVIINDDLDDSVRRVKAVLTAERQRPNRQDGLPEFVTAMCE